MSTLDTLFPSLGSGVFLSDRFPLVATVEHGPIERLPTFFREGPLASVEALTRIQGEPVRTAVGEGATFRQVSLRARAEDVTHLYAAGLTLFFPDVANLDPACEAWVDALADELGMPGRGRAGMFACRRGGGLPRHNDPNETFIIQLRGRKHIRVGPMPSSAFPALQGIGLE